MTTAVKSIVIILTLLLSLSVFGQKQLTLEDKIYNAVDSFVANPNVKSLKKLESFNKNISVTAKNKNELLALVVLNCNKAYFENQFNKTSQAISSYENAWKIYQKNHLKDYDIVEYCLKPLGNLYTIIGDYDNAENTIKQYYYIATQQKNQQQQYAAVLNLSNVYQNSGKIHLAIDLLEKTIQTEKLSNTQKGILLNNLGNSYVLFYKKPTPSIPPSIREHFFENLESSYLDAIQLLQSDKSQTETLANSYRNLASLNSQRQKFELANSYFEKAKSYFYATPNLSLRKKAKFKYEEASLLFQQQKLKESTAVIESVFKLLIPNYSNKKTSLPEQNSLYTETSLLDALDLRAEIYSKQNQLKKALESYNLAFHIEDLFSNMMVYENSKIINQSRVRMRTEKCIVIYDLLYQKEQKQTYIEAAFQLAEQSKSGVLKSYLLQNKSLSSKEKFHIEQLQNWSNAILKEQQKGDLANIVKINEAIKKQNGLMLSLKKIRSENTVSEKETIDIKSLFAQLEKDKAMMMEYFSGFEKMYYFTLENQKIKLDYYWDNHTATPKILSFLDYFSDANKIIDNISNYNHYGHSLYEMLKLPVNSNYKNLIIIPDGILNFLPFEALITQESNTTNFAQMHYLLNDYNIGYQNSASFYLNAKSASKRQKNVLGIFPVFENTPYTLTYSKDELHSIQKNFKGKYFKNSEASFDNFKKNAADYSILHLSTHADAGDVITPASIKFHDQEILYSELYHLSINPNLVVLSACETGIGKLYKSEGAMSVARGFQLAGAQNLLFSLWKVNDYTTSVFMDSFYQNIKNGQSYLEANANAKRDFLNNPEISNAKKSPYYWSAFVYYGTVKTNEKTNYTFIILGILSVIALIWLFIRYRK